MMVSSQVNRQQSIERTTEYNDFIAKLATYHQRRGTTFDPEPRVGSRHVDLLRLFETVVERGGYDRVSDEKLLWRKLGADFNHGGSSNLPAMGFALKTCYYKNLAAYEISTVHGKEPPPKEILEDLTAKGGSLLTRTVDNFRPSTRKDAMQGNEVSEASGDEGTPVRDGNAAEDTPGSGGRVSRGLRQAPPQRVLFQPDTQPSRQTRHAPSSAHTNSQHQNQQQQSSQPRGCSSYNNPTANTENMSHIVANYEPRLPTALSLRPVATPGHNPSDYARRQKLIKQQALLRSQASRVPQGLMLPGAAFDGPNIYVRCLCALKSGIPAEQDYALHHLVKISMERGDKYRFESFPGLAEALIEKVLQVSSLFYDIDWQVTYTEDGMTSSTDIIDGLKGTPDILERLENLVKFDIDDNVHSPEFSDALLQINEAALTLRNMVMLEENAYYASELAPLRDFLSIAVNLPNFECLVELKHYALDIAEQLTKYLSFKPTDPLYLSLLAQLQSTDRGAILTSLRAICRISMTLEESNDLKGVPLAAIENMLDWILLDDEDLVHACLDFLYQYTAVVDNVGFLLTQTQVEPLVNQLTRLLLTGANSFEKDYPLGRDHRRKAPGKTAPVPRELADQLMQLEEPERSSQWLRCLFEEDPDESITQIAIWQAYQNQFANQGYEKPIMQAAEFIKNVSTTFAERAIAQVQTGPVQKFIIKGIRMRDAPVGFNGEEFGRCKWLPNRGNSEQCSEYFMSAQLMFEHILQDHLHANQREDGKFNNFEIDEYKCRWEGCARYVTSPAPKLSQLASHIKLHLPAPPVSKALADSGPPPPKRHKPSYISPCKKQKFIFQFSPLDDHQYATGIPLSAVLVLRNLARNIPKTETDDIFDNAGKVSSVAKLFLPLEPHIFDIFAHNKTLLPHLVDLLSAIKDTQY